ncbi:bifunctional UDP-N-acetylglucosamine diphosphorylase/glucosamine-1-phosphate N-acetyltransferase GlmU [Heliorestis acidaminivorans]|uniref:Bifunctional protein GlmU n=1 Tax=Heliorestis acidaminivorans TaxID=553427 RepID=A0A6I0F3J8_9FIRM|nr:bifunctional UDP-N-acetylglucosamine diphosphorylase/glucosamine-1-phosphate N-acetyltransferase GlmU [Heliorestis acidaminivorans]KAB2953031.1 bifunctional UDP-N-acetylglucosamine diphosphorylase/glucosamine-1-phosphate N-acetyltransferase GlmU [Heliorestis acidaminivorans]
MKKRTAIVLAAGKGTRMKSQHPKVLHEIAGEPLIAHVVKTIGACGVKKPVVVIGHGGEEVQAYLGEKALYAWQKEQLGTGHAVMVAQSALDSDEQTVMVICGDTPLLTQETLEALFLAHEKKNALATVLTARVANPKGYGRILRDDSGAVQAIVEEKDATEEERVIKEINAGTYCFDKEALEKALEQIKPNNAQGEYYLTDVLAILRQQGIVAAFEMEDAREVMGINNRQQLAEAERLMQERLRAKWMDAGVTMVDPNSVWLHGSVSIEEDTIIYPQTLLEGSVTIGRGSVIGPGTRIKDSHIGAEVIIQNSIVLESHISDGCTVGPFAYLRPGTRLEEEVKVGDFVEIKKSHIGKGSKIPHLSYVGDALIGTDVNIGAGTITCNYDGENKHLSVVEDGAFIGSNTNLVAPVRIGEGSVIGAGSTITKDVPAGALAVERNRQIIKDGYCKIRQKDCHTKK